MHVGYVLLAVVAVVVLTLCIIIGGAIHVAAQRRRLGCGYSRRREPISWPETEYDGEPIFERPRDYEWFR